MHNKKIKLLGSVTYFILETAIVQNECWVQTKKYKNAKELFSLKFWGSFTFSVDLAYCAPCGIQNKNVDNYYGRSIVYSGNSKPLNSKQSLISKHFLMQTPIVYNINYMLNSKHLSLVNKIGDKTKFTITRVHCIGSHTAPVERLLTVSSPFMVF